MLIDGKKIADTIQEEIKQEILQLDGRPPCLSVILVGNHPASKTYVNGKIAACALVNIRSVKCELKETTSETELLEKIQEFNEDPLIDGILVQLPLPSHIDSHRILHSIDPKKDVDGFHPYNVGKMLIGETDGFFPCTPFGIKILLERMNIEVAGKHVLIIGRSNIVGKPMAALLMQNSKGGNATVTLAHSRSQNIKQLSLLADVIIVAIGQPSFLTEEMVKPGAVVIDVGMNKIADSSKKSGYRMVGDVDFAAVAPKCSFITPVPKGVGPMTIAMLLYNTLLSYKRRFYF